MVSLKLKGPRRRESERVKIRNESISSTDPEQQETMESKSKDRRISTKSTSKSKSPASTGASESTRATRHRSEPKPTFIDSSPGDTITVRHRTFANDVRNNTSGESTEVGPLYFHERVMSPQLGENSKSAQVLTGNGKARNRMAADEVLDLELPDADDAVVEYDLNNDADHGEDEDDGRDTMWYKKRSAKKTINDDVITISSDDGKDEQSTEWDLNDRPWKNFDQQKRYEWEMMYLHVTDYAMNGDWAVTELYQNEKDKEMLRYMEDFPLPEWVHPQHIVVDAYNRLLERIRWRDLGIRIYGRERVPDWMISSTRQSHGSHPQSMYMQPPLNGRSDRFSRDAPYASRYSAAMPPPQHYHPEQISFMTQHHPRGMPQPSPNQVLRSQPTAQPMPKYPNGMLAHPIGRAGVPGVVQSQMPNLSTQPYVLPMAHTLMTSQPQKRKGRSKKGETPTADAPSTPPYEKREKPVERKPVNKSGRRNMRRQAEAEEFPWNRLNIDFKVAKANATWDESIYDPATLANMEATRSRNGPIIEHIDQAESERQRKPRGKRHYVEKQADQTGQTRSKKKGAKADASSDTEQAKIGGRRKSSNKLAGVEGGTGDPYHSGHFEFTPMDQPKIAALGNKSPDEIMADVEDGKLALEECADLTICWNPGKKGITSDLEQARFSIKDTLLTRQQLAQTPILITRAAECIVDFCPDMLWRGMLLRIASEAGYGNKQVRDRMCLNGNYCDKATITKRIGSALGQKQQQSSAKRAEKAKSVGGDGLAGDAPLDKVKGYAKGEDEYYNENVQDFGDYVGFFGHRTSHRSQLNQAGLKRKRIVLDRDEAVAKSMANRDNGRGSNVDETIQSPEAMEISDDAETSAVEANSESEGEGDDDAVSVQSDTILDQLDDD